MDGIRGRKTEFVCYVSSSHSKIQPGIAQFGFLQHNIIIVEGSIIYLIDVDLKELQLSVMN